MIRQTFNKAFVGGHWSVLFRRHEETEYHEVKLPTGLWAADPFLYEVNGEHFLFAEVFVVEKNKGGIGYFRFIDGEPIYQGMVIKQPYHMSYPCIFEYQGTFYMIPETAANKTIEMYRAQHFPDKWVFDSVLKKGCNWVDTTVRLDGDMVQLFSYRSAKAKWVLTHFALDMQDRELTTCSEIEYSDNVGRPAGFFMGRGATVLRPAQNCSRKYGEEVIVYAVDGWNPYCEHEDHRCSISTFKTRKKYNRIHTMNSDSIYEVIDAREDRFDLLHGLKTFMRVFCRKRIGIR